jgi:hypothetical protein
MNAYEEARKLRIEQNRKRLHELVPPELTKSVEPAEQQLVPLAKKSKSKSSKAASGRRSSGRLAALPPVAYALPGVDEKPPPRKRGDGTRCAHGMSRGTHDREQGTSCHFCRQKTNAYKGSCTSCSAMFCAPCLWLRHGLHAEAVNALGDWRCAKCRGVCTCSICRRKVGKVPTGILGPKALSLGFAGAEGMLEGTHARMDTDTNE